MVFKKHNVTICLYGDERDGDYQSFVCVEEENEADKPLHCSACGGVVTSDGLRIGVGGSHRHTFFNPAGVVFELGCFRRAPGCIRVGEPSGEFSWFAGYVWSLALCLTCNSQLGWFFAGGDYTFYGLIINRLRH